MDGLISKQRAIDILKRITTGETDVEKVAMWFEGSLMLEYSDRDCSICPAHKVFIDDIDCMDTVGILSYLRSMYNCFDEDERPIYQALSKGIAAITGRNI